MFHSLRKPADACLDQYRGTSILLKISGKQLLQKEITQLVDDVKRLTREGIRFIIVFGGGEQIDQRWKQSYSKDQRPRVENGEAITTPEIRGYALDAYREICDKLRALMPEVLLIDPGSVHSVLKKGLQLTGEVQSIDVPDVNGIIAVGFIGTVDEDATAEDPCVQQALGGNRFVNVNADGVSRVLALRDDVQLNIKEVIMVTETKGVLNNTGRLVPVLTIDDVKKILAGEHPAIEAKDGMIKKLQECLLIAKKHGKAVMTDVGGVAVEIENYKGSGTLIFDPTQCSLSPLTEMQEPIFDAVYAKNVASGTFRERTTAELKLLKQHHWLFQINGSLLGGLSFVPRGDWIELETLWAEPIGNGLGQIVLNEVCRKAKGSMLYALAAQPQSIGAFRANANFEEIGLLEDLQKDPPVNFSPHLLSYDTTHRKPRVFILKADTAAR